MIECTNYSNAESSVPRYNIQSGIVSYLVEFIRMSTKKKNSLALSRAMVRPFSPASLPLGPMNTFSAQCSRSESGVAARLDSCLLSTVAMRGSGDVTACFSSKVRKLMHF